MLKLTLYGVVPPKDIWVNTKLVTTIVEFEGKTILSFDRENEVHVTESALEIGKMWNYIQ